MTEGTNISCEIQRAVPSGQDNGSPSLPARVANHGAVYDSACPLAEVLYVYSVVLLSRQTAMRPSLQCSRNYLILTSRRVTLSGCIQEVS